MASFCCTWHAFLETEYEVVQRKENASEAASAVICGLREKTGLTVEPTDFRLLRQGAAGHLVLRREP